MPPSADSLESRSDGDSIDSFVKEAVEHCDPAIIANPRAVLHSGDELSGRYRVEELARRGGMGAVYRATVIADSAPAAIKVMDRLGGSSGDRFEREAQVLAQLSHPAIVRYYGHGCTEFGSPYLAMEWLEGEDLSERLARRPLSIEESLGLAKRACEALAAAHARGIVHRDIKPSNLFLVNFDPNQVKLLDFGIARLRGTSGLTGTGAVIGTVGYMAPEQAMGEAHVDPRADVFAVGCVFYQCLTGRAPFESPHVVAVLAKVLREEPPPPSELRPGLDPRVDVVLRRLLAKDRSARPNDARAALEELEALGALDTDCVRRTAGTQSGLARAEQKIVSVILGKPEGVVTDLAASSAIDHGGSDLRGLSEKYSAELAPLQGGGLLLVLAGRGEANDRASQAVQCALALRQLRPALILSVSTGLAETTGRMPVGAAIDRAAALFNDEPGRGPGILVDPLTVGLVELRFEVRREGNAHVVIGERRDFDAPRLLMGKPTPCVGRDKELRLLDGTLEECIADSVSRAVLVTGAPGIGKSRLANEWLARNGPSRPARVFKARSEPMTSGSALSLVEQLLRSAASIREAEPIVKQHTKLKEYLRGVVSDSALEGVAQFLGEVLRAPSDDPPSPVLRAARNDPEIMREQIRRSLEAWIEAETTKRPIVLVLEDLHWADAPSVTFLSKALTRLSDRPLMILALARPEAEEQFRELRNLLDLRIRLPGLTPRAAERLLRAALSDAPAEEVIARVLQIADGNAFYLEELIRRVAAGSQEWPETVLAMAQSRLEQLEPAGRQVLRAASVFGETCWAPGVVEIVGPDVGAGAWLETLVDREILSRVPESRYLGATEYRFRHALLRDAAYAMLTEEDRTGAHRIAGDWLERVGERDAHLLADHFASGDAKERAIPWITRAARLAIDTGDLERAVAQARKGIALGAAGSERGMLLLAEGYAHAWSGRPDIDVLRSALDLLREGTAPWWLGLALLIWGASATGKPEQAATYVSVALQAPPVSEAAGPLGQGLLALVGGLSAIGRGELAATILERTAMSAPRGPGVDPVFEGFLALARCALASVSPVGGAWRLEYAYYQGRQSARQMGEFGAWCAESNALIYLSIAAMHLGKYEEAREACLQSMVLSSRDGSGLNQEWARVFLSKANVRLGNFDEALANLETLRSSCDKNVLHIVPVVAAEARYRQGNYAEAGKEAQAALTGASPRMRRMAGCLLARVELALGRGQAALAFAERAMGQPTSNGFESDIDLLTVLAEARFACGNEAGARDAIREAFELVSNIAASIDDEDLRRSFKANVEPSARCVTLAARWLGSDSP